MAARSSLFYSPWPNLVIDKNSSKLRVDVVGVSSLSPRGKGWRQE
jgi:hypothetical protein